MHFKKYRPHLWLPLKVHPNGTEANFHVKGKLPGLTALLLQTLLLPAPHAAPPTGSSRSPSQETHPHIRSSHETAGPAPTYEMSGFLPHPDDASAARLSGMPSKVSPTSSRRLFNSHRKELGSSTSLFTLSGQHDHQTEGRSQEKCCHMII